MVAVSISNVPAGPASAPAVPGVEAANALPVSIFEQLLSTQIVATKDLQAAPFAPTTVPAKPAPPAATDGAHAKGFGGRSPGTRFFAGPLDPRLLVPMVPAPFPLPTHVVSPAVTAADSAAPEQANSEGGSAANVAPLVLSSLLIEAPLATQLAAGAAPADDGLEIPLSAVEQPTLAAAPPLFSAMLRAQTPTPATGPDAGAAANDPRALPDPSWQSAFDSANPVRDARPAAADSSQQPASHALREAGFTGLPQVQGAHEDLPWLSPPPQRHLPDRSNPLERSPEVGPMEDASKLSSFLPASAAISLLSKPVLASAPPAMPHNFGNTPAANGVAISADFAVSGAPAKDTAAGSGNDSKPGSDRSSENASARDEAGFGQSLAVAGMNAANPHPSLTDASAQAATEARAAADPRLAGADQRAPVSEGSAPLDAPAAPAPHAADAPVVSAAHLAESTSQTEIRIEMQAGPLGAVELRAHISGDQIGASIAVEHHDAQVMLASDLPALHLALAGRNLNVNTLQVSQGMATSTGTGHGGGSYPHRTPAPAPQPSAAERETDAGAPTALLAAVDLSLGSTRLSVLA